MDKRTLLKTLLNSSVKWMNFSFSQEGEDIILDGLLGGKKEGFYVDIGAFHPFRFSNTAKFYHRGWRGLNIDATPGSMESFNRWRTRDINIEAGLSSSNEELIYYIFDEGALNTFDANCLGRLQQNGYIPTQRVSIQTYTIMQILDKYVKKNQKIDFMDIDIEGFDEKVILQMDFEKYHPDIIMIEKREKEDKSDFILKDKGYEMAAFTGRSVIYKNIRKKPGLD